MRHVNCSINANLEFPIGICCYQLKALNYLPAIVDWSHLCEFETEIPKYVTINLEHLSFQRFEIRHRAHFNLFIA